MLLDDWLNEADTAAEVGGSRGPYRKGNRYRGPCTCGQHAWAILTKGFVTFVDPEDANHLRFNWHASRSGEAGNLYYATRWVCCAVRGLVQKKQYVFLHRVILGESGTNDTDHIDHNGLNNRRNNLRPCTPSQNGGNARHSIGLSGFRGVVQKQNRWRARIGKGKPRQHLGIFTTSEEAARAYDAAAIARWGEFATLNFPNDEPHNHKSERSQPTDGGNTVFLDDWIDEKATEEAIGVSVRTLRTWRRKREGPPYTRFGRAVKYNKHALAAHFQALQVMPVRMRKRRAPDHESAC